MNSEQLRVGDAERDEVTTALHEHFAQGRLTTGTPPPQRPGCPGTA